MSKEFEELHRAADRLYETSSLEECYQATIDAAVNVLGLDWCSLVAPAADADLFEIKAISENGTAEVGDRPLALNEGVTGHVYQTRETMHLADVSESERAKPTDTAIRSALTVPVGDWGVFHAMSNQLDAFGEQDKKWTELLCLSLGTAIERKQREKQLEEKNERLEQFAGILSHDLRNPLNVAKLRLELAREVCETQHLDDIERALDRMERLTEDLLAIASEGSTSDKEPLSLSEFATICWQNVVTEDGQLRTKASTTVWANRGQLQQLLENLVHNAIEHGGQEVTIGELNNGFYLADDGPGIPAEKREDVFEMGYSDGPNGTGLGLAIVARIAEAHGWDARITESADGGARFEFRGVETGE